MDTFFHDLRLAARALARRGGFALTAILTLALGIGATTALFSLVHGVLIRSLPYPGADRIVRVEEGDRESPGGALEGLMSHLNYLDIQAEVDGLESVALYRTRNLSLTGFEVAEVAPGGNVTHDFFRVFRSEPILGRSFTAEETRYGGPDVAVVSHGFWRERLGERRDVVGTTVEIGSRAYTIVGVAPPGFDVPGGARLWTPFRNDDEDCGRGCVLTAAVGRIAPGATLEEANQQLAVLAERLQSEYPESNRSTTFGAAPLQDLLVGDVREALILLMLGVGMVLLIACANVANLMLARGAGRVTEVAVRAALGADRGRIVRQVLAESVVLAFLAGALGLALAYWGVDALKILSPGDIPRLDEVGVDGVALLFVLALALATPLLFGLVPALRLARTPVADAMRQGGRTETGGGGRTRSALLAAEVGLSLMLLLGAGLLLRSFARMHAVEPGFRSEGLAVFELNLPQGRYPDADAAVRATEELRVRLAALPGIRAATTAVGLPLGPITINSGFWRADQAPREPGQSHPARFDFVGDGYFRTLGIPLVSGRPFAEGDRRGSTPVAIVSREAAARYWPGESPIGRRIDVFVGVGYSEEGPRTVVGVVEDVRAADLFSEPGPEVYIPFAQSGPSFNTYVLSTAGDPATALAAARGAVQSFDPKLPMVRPGTMEELLAGQLARPRFYLLLLSLFAVLALSLALVGIYGVVAYAVSTRTREIGVRTALGAAPARVVRMVIREGLRPAALGAVLGLMGVMAGGRVMAGLLYGVRPTDPLTLVGTTLLLLGAVLLACVIPARRAARISPVVALREE